MSLEIAPADAGAIMLAHRWGYMSTSEVVELADNIIKKSVMPSAEICELSMVHNSFEIEERLRQFDKKRDRSANLTALLFKTLDLTKLDKPNRHRLYASLATYLDYEDPEPWSKIKLLEHDLEAAGSVFRGCEYTIERELINLICSAV